MSPARRLRGAAAAALAVLALAGASVAAQDWPRSGFPAPLAPRPVSMPPYELRTLPNGLPVLVVPHHEQPSVSFRLIVRAGALQEPAASPGVASLVAALLNQGTRTKSAGEIANEIESAGGLLATGSANELAFINGAVIKDRIDLMLALAAEMAQAPAFSPDEIDRQRSQMLSALTVRYDDPGYLADLVFNRLVFGAHPYGRPNAGTPESIRRLTREDLVAFHRTWFAPNNALLAIVGDLPAADLFAAGERAFGSWPRREVPAVRHADPPPPARRVIVVDRPGSAQTEIRAGHVASPRSHPDHLPLELTIRVLGGEGANRLFGVLRTERGLTYGASADLRTYQHTGQISAETSTRTAATGQALRLLVDEIAKVQREGVDPRELRAAQDFVSGNFPLTIETPAAIAVQVLSELFYGRDPRDIETYRTRVERVTAEDIQRVARTHLRPDALTIVLVGDAAAFASDLGALGFPEYERIPLAELDFNSPTLRRGRLAGPPPARHVPGQ